MRNMTQRHYINIFLLIALLIVSIAAFNAYLQIQRVSSANKMVVHTYDVITKNQAVLSTITQVELQVRNFVVFKNKNYLLNYDKNKMDSVNLVNEIKQLISDNPVQIKNVSELQKLIGNYFNEMNRLTSTKTVIDDRTRMGNLFATEAKISTAIIAAINNIIFHEQSLLQYRNVNALKNANNTNIAIIFSTVLTIILIILCLLFLNYSLTKKDKAEKERQALEERSQRMINASGDLIAAVDTNLKLISFNTAFAKTFLRLFDIKIKLGMPIKDAMPKTEMGSQLIEAWRKAVSGEEFTMVTQLCENSESHYEIRFNKITDQAENITGASHIIRDITERYRVEQLKNEFVSIVSHELRTPLTSIRGSLGLLLGEATGSLNEKTRSMLNIAFNNSERLIHIINDILDIEKIEMGKFDFHLRPTCLQKIISDSIATNAPYAEKYKVKIEYSQREGEQFVNADYERLMQVMSNLLSNAIKFSHSGGTVYVLVETKKDIVRTSIVDNGQGIAEGFHPKIFQKFSQADASSSRQKGGTGLGLNISKSIIEKMGGKIGFTSTFGQGSTFYFELPIVQNLETKSLPLLEKVTSDTTPKKYYLKRLSILYVEDDSDLSQIVTDILKSDAEVVNVKTGAETLKILRDHQFDLVLLDLDLPDQYGTEIIPELVKNNIPIVIFSAYELPEKYMSMVSEILIKSKTTNDELIKTIHTVIPR